MSVKDYIVTPCVRPEIKEFVEHWHYSSNVNGISSPYCFKLLDSGDMIGAMMYGYISMQGVWKKYVEKEADIIELRRLCCIDDTLKNTESYFIGSTLRWLKKNTEIKKVISYADKTYGHSGGIYKASNFKHLGMTQKSRSIVYNNKLYHEKTIRNKSVEGVYRPYALRIQQALKDGSAYYKDNLEKHIYMYELKE